MRISDWSSDVCSSDLFRPPAQGRRYRPDPRRGGRRGRCGAQQQLLLRPPDGFRKAGGPGRGGQAAGNRKSVVEGKRVSVRIDLGVRRIIKKKNKWKHEARKTSQVISYIYP